MKLSEVNYSVLEKSKMKCIYFSQTEHNKVVKGYKELYQLSDITENQKHSSLYIELEYYNNDIDYIILWDEYEFICNNMGRIQADNYTIEKLVDMLANYNYQGYEGFKRFISAKEDNKQFINLLEIEIFMIAGDIAKAQYFNNYRNEYRSKQEEKEQKERAEREQKQKEREAEEQKAIDDKLTEAEHKILNHETVYNEEIEESTLFLMLFKKHNISVPIKTQGWINKGLSQVDYREATQKYNYSYYSGKSGCNNSTVFRDYLLKLVDSIECKYQTV